MSLIPVLVTGGAGYIGAHCCKELKERGFLPITYDNLEKGHEAAVQWGPFEKGDTKDADRLREVFKKHQPQAVLHFAAHSLVGESVQDPAKYYRNNVSGALTLLEVCREFDLKHFIFSSTAATFGIPAQVPIKDADPQIPINPYGQSKLQVEQMLRDFDQAYGLRSISFRYFNAAGADAGGTIGEDHTPESHLIPIALDAALGVRPEITVFGEDYPTPDGTCIRDYIHVTDLATAHVLGLQALRKGHPTSFYNLGNGQGFSVKEVLKTIEDVTGRKLPVKMGERRAGDPPALVADASHAVRDLGWKPEHSSLKNIIATAWSWHQKMRGRSG